MKYYAIKDIDNNKYIKESWDEAKELISNLKSPKYKAFLTIDEAKAFLDDIELSDNILEPKAYIDGSYNDKTKQYGFGVILIIDNIEYKFKKAFDLDIHTTTRNVAGEIKASAFIINYAINHNIKKLHIFYDYEGIEAWFTKRWKANSNIALKYVEFRDNIIDKIEVIFHKVKGHSNNKYNDLVDKLAKEAVGI